MPTKPKMGGIQQQYKNVAWTRGKPDANWSSLLKTNPAVTPGMLRSEDPKASIAAHELRKKGLATKLVDTKGLRAFKSDVIAHLVEHGMDTIAYVPNPHDPTKMLDIVSTPPSVHYRLM